MFGAEASFIDNPYTLKPCSLIALGTKRSVRLLGVFRSASEHVEHTTFRLQEGGDVGIHLEAHPKSLNPFLNEVSLCIPKPLNCP